MSGPEFQPGPREKGLRRRLKGCLSQSAQTGPLNR